MVCPERSEILLGFHKCLGVTKGAHGRRARAAQEGPEGSPRHFAWLKNEEEPSPACLRQGKVSSSDLIFTSFELVTLETR